MLAGLLFSGALCGDSAAHPDADSRLRALPAHDDDGRCDSGRRVTRAEALRGERRFDEALAELARATGCDPSDAAAHLARARVLLDAGRLSEADSAVARCLASRTGDALALLVRARIRAAQARHGESAADYEAALAGLAAPSVDDVLAHAAELRLAGDRPRALARLDLAIEVLGPAPTLVRASVEDERRLGRTDAALARIDRLLATGHVAREAWLSLRGEVLESAGRIGEARAAWREALAALRARPGARRGTEAQERLARRLRERLAATSSARLRSPRE